MVVVAMIFKFAGFEKEHKSQGLNVLSRKLEQGEVMLNVFLDFIKSAVGGGLCEMY